MTVERKRGGHIFAKASTPSTLEVLPFPGFAMLDYLAKQFWIDRFIGDERWALIGERQRNTPPASQHTIDLHHGEHCGQAILIVVAEVGRGISVGVMQNFCPGRTMKKRIILM